MAGIKGVKGQGSARQFRVPVGKTADRMLIPIIGSMFFDRDLLKLWIYIGVGAPGTDAQGWFNLKNAQYSA